MKKHIAAIAAALITICSFTACDKKNQESSSDVSSSQSVTEAAFDQNDAEKKVTEAINEYFSAINNGDMKKVFEFQYNEEDMPAAAVMAGFGHEGGTAQEACDSMMDTYKEGYKDHVISLNSVKSISGVSEKGYELLDELYGRVLAIKGLLAEHGGDSGLDIQAITDAYGAMTDFSQGKQDYEEAYDVVAEITLDDTQKEQEMIVFRTKNGNWKIDMTVINYMQQVEQTDLNNAASEIAGAMSEAIMKMQNEGTEITSNFIISSDESKNYLIPDSFDMKKFNEYFSSSYTSDASVQYFFVIYDSKVASGAYVDAEGKTGLYPIGLIMANDGEGNFTYEEPANPQNYTFDQLYDMSKNVLDGLNK